MLFLLKKRLIVHHHATALRLSALAGSSTPRTTVIRNRLHAALRPRSFRVPVFADYLYDNLPIVLDHPRVFQRVHDERFIQIWPPRCVKDRRLEPPRPLDRPPRAMATEVPSGRTHPSRSFLRFGGGMPPRHARAGGSH